MSNHTPGPWSVDVTRPVAALNGDIAVVNDHGTLIAVAYLRRGKQTGANAILIAAAPELLAALEELAPLAVENTTLIYYQGASGKWLCRWCLTPEGKAHLESCSWRRAREVIAKARGETA